MPLDMKERIADAVHHLVMEEKKNKVTVKDIVEECQITRQAFYYHFEDIPALIRWMLEREMERMLHATLESEDPEQQLKYLFRMAINAGPSIRRGLKTNYGSELTSLLEEYATELFKRIIETKHLCRSYSQDEAAWLVRYHTKAILGILRDWTDEDTKHLDEIVHWIAQILEGKLSPHP